MPDEQAEPEDTEIPSRSKPITAVSAFSPGTVKSVVLGSLHLFGEHNHAPGLPQRILKTIAQLFDP